MVVTFFFFYNSGSQPFRCREPNPDLRFCERATRNFFPQVNWQAFFIALTKPVTQNIRGVTEKHCLTKRILPSKESDTKLLQSTNFAYEVGVISSYSNRIRYRKIAKSRTKDAWELHAALRTVFENHCSTSDTTPASYDLTALEIVKPKKHQRLADPLLQSGVVTRNNRV